MKVLLINPWTDGVFPPPAIGYLQAVLKYWKVDVAVCNIDETSLMNDDYDLVGVTFHSLSVKYARQIRTRFKGRLICGGHHPSALPYQMLSIGYDQVVVGEGEDAIISIIQGNNDKIIKGEDYKYKYFASINDIPFPDYTELKFSGDMGIPIISSRGCPYSCNFCASSVFWHHKYYVRSADNVLCEIEKRKSEGFKSWMFEDDNFTLNKSRVYEICERLDGKYLWNCTSRAETLDVELCKELHRAGCRKIWLGIESLSQAALDRCNKNTTVEKMLQGIQNARDAGIETICQFIIGMPGDTLDEIKETQDKINKYRLNASYHIAQILPGTEIHKKAKEHGFKDEQYLESETPLYTYEQSIETLNNWVKLCA